jgi:hypothetical protein
VRKGFAEVVLVISREVQWLLLLAADHGWLWPGWVKFGERPWRFLARGRTQNVVSNLT